MALGSKAFVALAGLGVLTAQTVELRHDHRWKSGSGILQVTSTGLSWTERSDTGHSRTWRWQDIQQLTLAADSVRILTYEDAKWRGWRDREYSLQGAPEGFAAEAAGLLREHLQGKLVLRIAGNAGSAFWSFPVKLRKRLGGSEGDLTFSPGLLMYTSREPRESRTWPLGQIEMVSSSGPYELTVLPREKGGWSRGRREFRFQLKQPIGDADYQQFWMEVQKANGLALNANQMELSEKEHQP